MGGAHASPCRSRSSQAGLPRIERFVRVSGEPGPRRGRRPSGRDASGHVVAARDPESFWSHRRRSLSRRNPGAGSEGKGDPESLAPQRMPVLHQLPSGHHADDRHSGRADRRPGGTGAFEPQGSVGAGLYDASDPGCQRYQGGLLRPAPAGILGRGDRGAHLPDRPDQSVEPVQQRPSGHLQR